MVLTRSFLGHFSKRTFTVNDQVKLVNQFLIVHAWFLCVVSNVAELTNGL